MKEKVNELRNKLKNSLSATNNSDKPRPIFIILLIVVVLFAGVTLVMNSNKASNKTNEMPAPSQEQTSSNGLIKENFISKITDKVKNIKILKKEEYTPVQLVPLPSAISLEEIKANKDRLLEINNEIALKFSIPKVAIEDTGRKDPFRPLNENSQTTSMKDPTFANISKQFAFLNGKTSWTDRYYFVGLNKYNVFLTNIYTDTDGIVKAKFSILGGIFSGVREGDYVNNQFYLKTINTENNSCVLVDKVSNKEFVIQDVSIKKSNNQTSSFSNVSGK